jgi:hypothetical protein
MHTNTATRHHSLVNRKLRKHTEQSHVATATCWYCQNRQQHACEFITLCITSCKEYSNTARSLACSQPLTRADRQLSVLASSVFALICLVWPIWPADTAPVLLTHAPQQCPPSSSSAHPAFNFVSLSPITSPAPPPARLNHRPPPASAAPACPLAWPHYPHCHCHCSAPLAWCPQPCPPARQCRAPPAPRCCYHQTHLLLPHHWALPVASPLVTEAWAAAVGVWGLGCW